MAAPDDFIVFIFSHSRADNFKTLDTLKRHGYTGPLRIIIDNEDKTAARYYEKFGDLVYMFDKAKAEKLFDVGDNFGDRRAVVFARNAAYGIARELGYTYFLQLEDDYVDFRYKINSNGEAINKEDIKNLDAVFGFLLEYYKSTQAKCIAMAQGGDFLGGKDGNAAKNPMFRKVMNSLFCSTDRPVQFVGRLNDDVNTYVESGRRGNFFLMCPIVALQQLETQKNTGGNSDIYLKFGTYVKSFISVMYAPSCVSVRMMRSNDPRLHHQISWNNAVPRIVSEAYRKND
jgi:hypothetical protein